MKHMKKRVAALLLTLAMVLSLAPMAFAADEFPDMPAEDDPSYAAVKSAVDNAIMTGENGELNLEGTILRSTVAKMVVTAFAAKGEADLSGYPDVNSEAWYAAWMAKANQMGIMTGASGKMNPGSEVTLAEVAAMLVRALGLPVDKDATVDGVAAWAAPYVKALLDAGLIDDAADAGKPMTRGAFAEVIFRVSGGGNYAKEENAEITEDVNGNIVITANGVSLKGITVKGDIIIADGVDAGSVVLDGVKVEGRIVVRGAGAELTNGTTAGATVVAATTGETTVKADASSSTGDIAVAGTNGMAADKVVLDMAEPNATVTAATEVAVQNAKGGEITLQAPNASLSVESGTVANVTVADGASGVKVDVAEGATIDKVTTNTDLAITGEGAVNEKAGSGTVTDGSGAVVDGSDEPVDVPTVEEPPAETDPNAPTNPTHTHNYAGTPTQFDATRHTIACVNKSESSAGAGDAITGCGAVIYEAHNTDGDEVKDGEIVIGHKCTCGYNAVVKSSIGGTVTDGKKECGVLVDGQLPEGAAATHDWEVTPEAEGTKALTCTQDGVVIETCKNCGKTRTTTTPATGHSLTPFKTVAPTCGTAGATYFKCTNTGCTMNGSDWNTESPTKTTVKAIPATNQHNWVQNGYKAGDGGTPTCTATGFYHYECANDDCGETPATDDTKVAPKLPHSFTGTVTEIDGDNTHHNVKCATCAETKVMSCTFAASEAEGKPAAAPTCTGAGKTATLVCACGNETGGAAIPALGHDYQVKSISATQHQKVCTRCQATDGAAENHKWNAVDAEKNPVKDAVCTKCGYRYTAPVQAHTCQWGSWTKQADNSYKATCTVNDGTPHGTTDGVKTHTHSYAWNNVAGSDGSHTMVCANCPITGEASKTESCSDAQADSADGTDGKGKCDTCDANMPTG